MAIPYAPSRIYEPDSRLIDLVLQAGNNRARLQQQGGQIWGQTLGNLGGIAADAITRRGKEKQAQAAMAAKQAADAPRLAQEAEIRDLTIEEKRRGQRKAVSEEEFATKLGALFSGEKPPTPNQIIAASAHDPERGFAIAKGMSAIMPGSEERYRDQMTLLRDALGGVTAVPDSMKPQVYSVARQSLDARGLIPQEMAHLVPPEFTPESFAALSGFGRKAEEPGNLDLKETSQGLQTWDPRKGTLGPVVGQPKQTPRDPKPVQTFEQGGIRYQMNPDGTASPVPIKGGPAPASDSGEGVFVNQPAYKSLTTKQKSQAVALDGLVKSLADYRELLDSTTDATGVNLIGKDAGRLRSRASKLKFSIAQAEETGALQKADAEIIGQMLGDPTDLTSAPGNALRGGKAAQTENVDNLIADYDGKLKSMGLTSNKRPAASAAAPSGSPKPIKGRLVQDTNGVWKRVY